MAEVVGTGGRGGGHWWQRWGTLVAGVGDTGGRGGGTGGINTIYLSPYTKC